MKEFELEAGERVLQEVRKHWFIFALQLLPFAILVLLPLALPNLFGMYEVLKPFSALDFTGSEARLFLGAWWLLVWIGAFNRFTDYYLDAWILTNMRIVDINQKGFFRRQVSSLLLNRVQDVTVATEGILVSLFDIGDIHVQSAGTTERFKMRGIPHPGSLRDTILKYVPNNPAAHEA